MDFQVFNLTLDERFALMELFPHQGNFATLGLIEGLKRELLPDEKDFKELDIVEIGEGGLKWNVAKDKGKNFEIGPILLGLIYKALNDAEKGDKLNVKYYTLFKKIAIPRREAEEVERKKGKK